MTFDWDYWPGSSRPLEPRHASIARQPGVTTEAAVAERIGDKTCARLVHRQAGAFRSLATALHARHLSAQERAIWS